MTSWEQFEKEAPDLAAAVFARLAANKHHVLATLRRDGSPRVSGTEVEFVGPDLTLGAMPGAVKTRDLRRDGRYSLHTNPGDESMEGGDAKISGVAVEVTDQDVLRAAQEANPAPGPFDMFVLGVEEVAQLAVTPDGEALLVQVWRVGEPVRRFERRTGEPAATRLS
jgi:hypothetical protein